MSNNKKNAEKAQNAAAQNTNGVTTENAAPAAEPKEEAKPQTVGEVIGQTMKDLDNKQKELERKQKELKECLAVLEHKKTLSEHRSKFIEKDEKLNEALEKLQGDEFENPHYRLTLKTYDGYREREDVVSISNTELINAFVVMLREKIASKVLEIETELMQ